MINIRAFNSTSLGESHKAIKKVCQDSSACYEDAEKGHFICAVSDGHGGDMYFRSDRGSKLLTNITIQSINQFIESVDNVLFAVPYTAIPARTTEVKEKIFRKVTRQDDAFRRLFSSIISQWNDGVIKDWSEDTPSIEEMQSTKVPESAIKSFLEGKGIEFAYGCTLIAIVRTPEYWFALQLGDGKCIAFDSTAQWSEPIPWDEQCNGSKTTSTCESNPLDNLRYCYANNNFPVALFIGSDGLDGAYGNIEDLALFYSEIIKSFVKNGFEKTVKEIDDSLPILSTRGISRDDMSLAGVVDMNGILRLFPFLLQKNIEMAKMELLSTVDVYEKMKENILEKESEIKQKQAELNSFRNIIKDQEETIAHAKNKHNKAVEDLKQKEIDVNSSEVELNHMKSGLDKHSKAKEVAQKKLADLTEEFNNICKEDLIVQNSDLNVEEMTDSEAESKGGSSSDTKKGWWPFN